MSTSKELSLDRQISRLTYWLLVRAWLAPGCPDARAAPPASTFAPLPSAFALSTSGLRPRLCACRSFSWPLSLSPTHHAGDTREPGWEAEDEHTHSAPSTYSTPWWSCIAILASLALRLELHDQTSLLAYPPVCVLNSTTSCQILVSCTSCCSPVTCMALGERCTTETPVVVVLLFHLHLHVQTYNYASVVEELDIEKTLASPA
jgi:hypothetical protein